VVVVVVHGSHSPVAAAALVVVVVVVVHGSHSPVAAAALVVVVVVVVHGSHSPVAAAALVVVVVDHVGSQSVQVEAVVVVVVLVVVEVHAGSHSSQLVVVFDGQSVTSGPQEVMVTSTEAATAATRPATMIVERILMVIDLFCSKKSKSYVGWVDGLVLETNVSEL
jgi:hypothetical protein